LIEDDELRVDLALKKPSLLHSDRRFELKAESKSDEVERTLHYEGVWDLEEDTDDDSATLDLVLTTANFTFHMKDRDSYLGMVFWIASLSLCCGAAVCLQCRGNHGRACTRLAFCNSLRLSSAR
jgi:hypothetical protein